MQTSSPPPSSAPPPGFSMDSIDDASTSIWDLSQLLDFNIDDNLPLPAEETDHSQSIHELLRVEEPEPESDSFPVKWSSGKVRKRDPRMACSNFLAGQIPCACPELDALLAAEEEEGAPGKKKTRARCQVPSCEVDISELKGYHKRHRVCLRCATATTVLLHGQNKRYCQQCGKFHMLSDFDEGKRSCRRKLERHNNRRRRKPSESKRPGIQSADYDDDAGKGLKSTSNEIAGDKSNNNLIPNSNHIQSESIRLVSGETQTDEEKGIQSPSYCDDKSAFSSICPTGRISFKLYDLNPAAFPRRLRHQIFQWLASMPVELEGYIRPGCTILTLFIAMPSFMWVKLSEDPVVSVHDLLASPESLLSGRDTFFVNINGVIFSVIKGGRSVVKIKAGDKSPKLHYVQPTCFEAGKPIEFLACGSNLLQPRLRFLVSFGGKYMTNDVCVSSSCEASSTTNLENQILNIRVPHTEFDVFGPAFIEVENESGLSNFIPILVADKEICSEIKTMQMKYYSTHHSLDSNSDSSTTISCEVAVKKFSELLVDIAWLLKQPIIEDDECVTISSQLQRFKFLINFLIKYESTTVLKRILKCVNMKITKNGGMVEGDWILLKETVNHATQVLNQRLEKKINLDLVEDDDESHVLPLISNINQDIQKSEKVTLLNADHVMSVTPYKEQPTNRMFSFRTNRFLTPRPMILAVGLATVCFGICAVVLHPQKATAIAVTIHRCLFDDN